MRRTEELGVKATMAYLWDNPFWPVKRGQHHLCLANSLWALYPKGGAKRMLGALLLAVRR
jgi:hypothetical protein